MSSGKTAFQITPGAEGLVQSLGLFSVQDGWREDLPGKLVNDRGGRQVVCLVPDQTGVTDQEVEQRVENRPLVDGGDGPPGRVVYLKRWRFAEDSPYRYLPGKNALRHRAKTESENLHILKNIGIRVPEPLLLAEQYGLWGPVATLLLLEGLVEYVPASEWIQEHQDGAEFLCQGIARLVATLHRNGYFYRSPGLKHFYVWARDPVSGKTEDLALIDVPRLDHGCCSWLKTPSQWLGADPPCPERDLSKVLLTLTQELGASKKDLDVFWTTYCAEVGVGEKADQLRHRVLDLAKERSRRRGKRRQ